MILNLLYFLIAAFVVIVMLHFVAFLYKKNCIPVTPVIAGPTSNTYSLDNRETVISPFETFYFNGKSVNPKKYKVCRVVSESMGRRGIIPNDLVFIKEFKEQEDKKSMLNKGDILYIQYPKNDGEKGYKLREFDRIDGEKILTIHYTAKGEIEPSTGPHKLEDILGIVKMKFTY